LNNSKHCPCKVDEISDAHVDPESLNGH
jgi:hypothetical protein